MFWVGPGLTPWLADTIETLAQEASVTALSKLDGTVKLEFRESAMFEVHDHDDHSGHDDHADHDADDDTNYLKYEHPYALCDGLRDSSTTPESEHGKHFALARGYMLRAPPNILWQ